MIKSFNFDTFAPKGLRVDLLSTFEDPPAPVLVLKRPHLSRCASCEDFTNWHEVGIDGEVPMCSFLCCNNLHGAPTVTYDEQNSKLTIKADLNSQDKNNPQQSTVFLWLPRSADQEVCVQWPKSTPTTLTALKKFQGLLKYVCEIMTFLQNGVRT